MLDIEELDSKILLQLDIKTLKDIIFINKQLTNILLSNHQFWFNKCEYEQLPILNNELSFQQYIKISTYRKQAEKILVINDIECNQKTLCFSGSFQLRFNSCDRFKLHKLLLDSQIEPIITKYNISDPIIFISMKPVINGIKDLLILICDGVYGYNPNIMYSCDQSKLICKDAPGYNLEIRYSANQFINFIIRCLHYNIGNFHYVYQKSLSQSLDYLGDDVIKNHLDKIKHYLDNIK